MTRHDDFARWLYRGGRPNRLGRLLNRMAIHLPSGPKDNRLASLEVRGRRTGRTISFPVVVAQYQGERYLVAMLGDHTNWVRNVEAAGGRAVLRQGRREDVQLEPAEPDDQPRILRRYLEVAPGARPHIPLDRGSSDKAFAEVAERLPIFHVGQAHPAHEPV